MPPKALETTQVPAGAAPAAGQTALEYWQAQEEAPLPVDVLRELHADTPRLPGGWWLVPVIGASILFWAALIIGLIP